MDTGVVLKNGDCLDLMKDIPNQSIDMILCDLPYGVLNKKNTAAKWDQPLPLDSVWNEYKRIIKTNGAIILFSQGMFTAQLMLSNVQWWRYNLIWKKGNRSTGYLNANRMPLRNHEDICVFYPSLPTYHPQMRKGKKNHARNTRNVQATNCYGKHSMVQSKDTDLKFPISVIEIEKEQKSHYHSTQKPIALLEYLIRTYSNEGDIVLDNTMGSGSCGVACVRTGRNFIGMEIDEKFYEIAHERIKEAVYAKSIEEEWKKICTEL